MSSNPSFWNRINGWSRRLLTLKILVIGLLMLLLSITEHLSFDRAYCLSCVVILILIPGYSGFVLRNRKLTWLVGGMLLLL